MSRSICYTLIAVLFSLSFLFAESSFVGFKQNEISVKITQDALQLIDNDMFSAGLTGISDIDQLNNTYSVQT